MFLSIRSLHFKVNNLYIIVPKGKLLHKSKRIEVVCMFSDIRGFTNYSEKNNEEKVIEVLNYILKEQAIVIDKNHGSIDKFVGDEIVATFSGINKIENSLKSAREIQR